MKTKVKLNQNKQWNNLNKLLDTQESKIKLSEATDIPIAKINSWLNPSERAVSKADLLIIMAKYFGCTVDYLLDLSNVRDRR